MQIAKQNPCQVDFTDNVIITDCKFCPRYPKTSMLMLSIVTYDCLPVSPTPNALSDYPKWSTTLAYSILSRATLRYIAGTARALGMGLHTR